MIEAYIEYWGLSRHPFLLAPDSSMMHVTGQYFECLERLKYAINTNKGGAIVISEDAGLGKTTILLKLIEEMRTEYGDSFRYAFVDHPTLTSEQMIAEITGAISGLAPSEDKLKNLSMLRSAMIESKEQGGKNIIIVDEGQMLCEKRDVLQELRALINLTNDNEYLHTFILSGQRALWQTVKDMPEFWQRLPVRYYFVPLKLEEAKELLRHRLCASGMGDRDIFSTDAFEMVHRYSRGSPRTLIALADLCLLIGCSDRVPKVGFKEVSKAISTMSGKGETLPYMGDEMGKKRGPFSARAADGPMVERPPAPRLAETVREDLGEMVRQRAAAVSADRFRILLIAMVVTVSVVLGGAASYLLLGSDKQKTPPVPAQMEPVEGAVKAAPSQTATVTPLQAEQPQQPAAQPAPSQPQPAPSNSTGVRLPDPVSRTEPREDAPRQPQRIAEVTVDGANVRLEPSSDGPRLAIIFRGETLSIRGERTDRVGSRWYRVSLYGDREGWISADVVRVGSAASRQQ